MRLVPLIVVAFPLLAWAQGPIETRNHEPASLVFLRLDPRGALLAPGERTLGLDFSSANALRFEGDFREDNETERLGVRFGWGVRRGEWRVEVPFLSRGGGFQDPLINAYHRLLGIGEFRNTVPFGRDEERLGSSGSFDGATGLGDIAGSYARALGPQAFVSFALKLPTGNAGGLLGSGAVDAGVALYARWSLLRRLMLYGQLGGVLQGDPTRLERARRFADQESLSLDYTPNSRDGYVLQWQSEPAAIRTGETFPDGPHRQLTAGYSRRLSSRDRLQLYFNEDGDFLNFRVPELVNIAPDFTFGVNFSRRF